MQTATKTIRTIYRVREWNLSYERNRSREIRVLEWVPFPNRMADFSYIELMTHPNREAYFGIWHALVYIASRCVPRGDLLKDNGQPLRVSDIAAVARMSEPLITEAIPIFIELGWLEEVPTNAATAVESHAKPNGHTTAAVTPFDEWWELWTQGTQQTSNHAGAIKEWQIRVTPQTLKAALECTRNYVASDRTVRGIGIPNPENWIRKNAKDNWTARWPKAKPTPTPQGTKSDAVKDLALANLKRTGRII